MKRIWSWSGATGAMLSALLVTAAGAQEADYPVNYGETPAAAAPAPAGDQKLATAAPENSGPGTTYQCCQYGLLAGPLEGPEAWTLSPAECRTRVGGWVEAGYTSGYDRTFATRPDELNFNQVWLWLERTADGKKGIDWGYRADLMYGIDAHNTQAYGNPAGTWDYLNGWDHGAYGWAMPQLYGTLAIDDLTIKAGHFFTPMGYEVVQAPQNFFYSHSLSFYYSEPITHTGMMAEYPANENLKFYGGWVAGWDTGFDQLAGGSAFMGGFSSQLFERLKMSYMFMAGNEGWRGEGYNHSLVFDYKISERLNYVLETDLVNTNGSYVTSTVPPVFLPGTANDQVGLTQYLFYKLSYKLSAGARAEWWKSDGISAYEVTYGLNYKPIPNFCLRPEVKHQWCPADPTFFEDQTVFGMDGYLTF